MNEADKHPLARQSLLILFAGMACCLLSGCGLLHELQPHRLHRWNYNDRPRSHDAFYSVPDRLPATLNNSSTDEH